MDQKYPFCKNLFRKIVYLAEIWYQDYFEYAEFDDDIQIFSFGPEIPFLANLVQKIKITCLS